MNDVKLWLPTESRGNKQKEIKTQSAKTKQTNNNKIPASMKQVKMQNWLLGKQFTVTILNWTLTKKQLYFSNYCFDTLVDCHSFTSGIIPLKSDHFQDS